MFSFYNSVVNVQRLCRTRSVEPAPRAIRTYPQRDRLKNERLTLNRENPSVHSASDRLGWTGLNRVGQPALSGGTNGLFSRTEIYGEKFWGMNMNGMKRLLPGRKELAVFAMLAVVFAVIVSLCEVSQHDVWLAVLTVPLFIFAAVLGLRRSPQWQTVEEETVMGDGN